MSLRIRDLSDVDDSSLTQSANKFVLRYNFSENKFDLVDIDDILVVGSETLVGTGTNYFSDSFVTQVENEVDTDNTPLNYDAGSF